MKEKILIIGVGLIGGSLAKALKTKNNCYKIYGYNARKTNLKKAIAYGVIDEIYEKLENFETFSFIIISVPVKEFSSILNQIQHLITPQTTIIDVCSVKKEIVEKFSTELPQYLSQFIPCHPIAGKEKSGVEASLANLFLKHKVIITRHKSMDEKHLEKATQLWQSSGAEVDYMTSDYHDKVLSSTSHLPHLLAFCLVDYLYNLEGKKEIFNYAAGGFKDFTRIAMSDAKMWHDIFFSNDNEIEQSIDGYIQNLQTFKQLITHKKSEGLMQVLNESKQIRFDFENLYNDKIKSHSIKDTMNYKIKKANTGLTGTIKVDGDKSISHRAVIFASIAQGTSRISNFLDGLDNQATIKIFQDLGVQIIQVAPETIEIVGKGKDGLKSSKNDLDVQNSGTAIRLIAGLLAGQNFKSVLTGDNSILSRPMQRVVKPLKLMGADIQATNEQYAPLIINPTQSNLKAIEYELPVASAQVKSCILLAGLYAQGTTKIIENKITRNHTENMLKAFGVNLTVNRLSENKSEMVMKGGQELSACDVNVPGDISSASFFIVASLIVPNSNIIIKNVGMNPTRKAVIDILKLMGAKIEVQNLTNTQFEPTADLHIQYSELVGIDIPHQFISIAIDEFPIVFIAASQAKGKTKLTGAKELRVKESDRITAMVDGLNNIGVHAEALEDGIIIEGGQIKGGKVQSFGDHRIAMSFAIAGMVAQNEIEIEDCQSVATSFPNFVARYRKLGGNIDIQIC